MKRLALRLALVALFGAAGFALSGPALAGSTTAMTLLNAQTVLAGATYTTGYIDVSNYTGLVTVQLATATATDYTAGTTTVNFQMSQDATNWVTSSSAPLTAITATGGPASDGKIMATFSLATSAIRYIRFTVHEAGGVYAVKASLAIGYR